MQRLTQSQSITLDLMRGLSAQVVLIGHAFDANGVTLSHYFPDLAVVVFLFLSGFLVTYSAAAKGAAYSFTEFVIDRGSRIFVPYVPAMLIVIIAGLALDLPGPMHIFNALTTLFMLQDYPLASYLPENTFFQPIGTARPWWTVAFEWWFYWAFGALYFFLRHPRPRWILLIVGLPGFIVAIFQSVSWVLAYPWIVGCAGAFLFMATPKLPRAHVLLLPLLALACIRYYFNPSFYDLQGMIVTCTLAWTAIVAAKDLQIPSAIARFATVIAGYSYSLYLLNATVILALQVFMPANSITFIVMFVFANAAAFVFSLFTERHYKTVANWLKQALDVTPRSHPTAGLARG